MCFMQLSKKWNTLASITLCQYFSKCDTKFKVQNLCWQVLKFSKFKSSYKVKFYNF